MEFYDFISVQTFWTILLTVHGLLSIALLGALTHQAIAVAAPLRRPVSASGVVVRLRAVAAPAYAASVCGLWIASFVFGAWIYTKYRIDVRVPIEQEGFWKTLGAFEMKEHMTTLGLGLLPIYALLWRSDDPAHEAPRRHVTYLLAAICWFAFLVGHVVNNVRGFGS